MEIDALAFDLTVRRIREEARAGQDVGAKASLLKYVGAELNKRRHELMMDAGGSEALSWEGPGDGKRAKDRLRMKGNSIEGGASEVQLNILANHVLAPPGA